MKGAECYKSDGICIFCLRAGKRNHMAYEREGEKSGYKTHSEVTGSREDGFVSPQLTPDWKCEDFKVLERKKKSCLKNSDYLKDSKSRLLIKSSVIMCLCDPCSSLLVTITLSLWFNSLRFHLETDLLPAAFKKECCQITSVLVCWALSLITWESKCHILSHRLRSGTSYVLYCVCAVYWYELKVDYYDCTEKAKINTWMN